MKKLIVGNWKMNPSSLDEAVQIASEIKEVSLVEKKVTVILCSPYVFLNELSGLSSGNFLIGAQDSFWEKSGAFTGEVSPLMLSDLGIKYVIVGHSERRALGETDLDINKKLSTLFKLGFKCILCVGERERDGEGKYLSFLRGQLENGLKGISRKNLKNLIVAYEPLWAIGDKAERADTPHETNEVALFIKRVLSEVAGRELGLNIPILYGGSVDNKNAEDFLKNGGVDGLLVGRASLNKNKFSEIIKKASSL